MPAPNKRRRPPPSPPAGCPATPAPNFDSDLRDLVRRGDENGAAELVHRCKRRELVAVAWRVVHCADRAKDAYQETLMALTAEARRHADLWFPSGWLRTVTHHAACHIVKMEKKQPSAGLRLRDEDGMRIGANGAHPDEHTGSRFLDALRTVPANRRRYALLMFWSGLKQCEIAELLQESQPTVHRRVKDVTAHVIEELNRDEEVRR